MPLRLKRLNIGEAFGVVVDSGGKTLGYVYPTPAFVKRDNDNCDAIESHVSNLELQAAIDTVNGLIDDTNDALASVSDATDASAAATVANARWLNIRNSNVTGLTITATDAGASVTVTFSAHQRNYTDGTSVAVSGGSITGLPYSTDEYFFYDQASLAGGAVVYQSTTNGPNSLTTDASGPFPDRHLLGSLTTPAALGGPVDGGTVIPPIDTSIHGVWA